MNFIDRYTMVLKNQPKYLATFTSDSFDFIESYGVNIRKLFSKPSEYMSELLHDSNTDFKKALIRFSSHYHVVLSDLRYHNITISTTEK